MKLDYAPCYARCSFFLKMDVYVLIIENNYQDQVLNIKMRDSTFVIVQV